MCKEIIEKNMKGSLEVENCKYNHNDENHTGACFKIKLPLNK